MSAGNAVLINVGTRTWDLKPLTKVEEYKDDEGKTKQRTVVVQHRQVLPGQSIETLDEAEAKDLLNHFRDWRDAAKVVPANANRIASMQSEIDRLTAENAKLGGGHKAPKEEKSDDDGKHKEKKGK